MRGIKPYKVGFLTRPFEWKRAYHLGVSTFLYFPFDPPSTLYTDLELWNFVAEALPTGTVLDQGIPKSRAEYLVVGSAFQPGGNAAPTCPVKVEIGSLKKTLYVIGDREWKKGVPTEPAPFTELPLSWERAFGGEGYAKNPLGRGAAVLERHGHKVQPLPNVETPGHLVTSPRDRPEPAGFGAIDFTWPQRFSLAGTYDRAWFDTLYPGYAADLDWRIWNAAPEDQWHQDAFRGDERMVFENMHPSKPKLEARLPGVLSRAFIVRAGSSSLEEVPLRPMTIWAFPQQERGVVVFQGATTVTEDDARDVDAVMVVAERIGEPRTIEHYQAAYEKRCDPARLAETLDESDIVPADLVGFGPDIEKQLELTTPRGHRATLAKEIGAEKVASVRAELEALGLDADVHGPKVPPPDEPPPNAAELARMMAEKQEEAQRMRVEGEQERAKGLAELKPLYEAQGLDFAELEREIAEPPGGPPEPRADVTRDEIKKLIADMDALGHPVDELSHYVEDPSFYEQWQDADQRALDSYRTAAHFRSPVRVDPERAALARAHVERAIAAKEPLRGADLTGADLSGMDLRGVDFAKALLEAATFRGSDLSGAIFDGAVLAHADLTASPVERTSFRGANLGRAKLEHAASVSWVDFTGAVLWAADLSRARLLGARLSNATLMEATFEETDLERSTGKELVLYKSRLSGSKLAGIQWSNVAFMEVEADGIDLSGATLTEATFVKWRGSDGRFVNANLTGARFVMECVLDRADLKGATLDKANLRGVSMRGADLSGAKLNGADLSEAVLEEARLYRIVARDSMWMRTDLKKAQLVSADLFNAIMQKADIRGADLRGANLYGVDFALVRGDADTRIEDAIQDRLRARPRRQETP